MTDLSVCAAELLGHDNFEILTHNYPDGDTLGAGYGLCLALRSLGKHARVINSGEPAAKYGFLSAGVPDESFDTEYIVSVDVAAPSLLGKNEAAYSDRIDLCIDHHSTNSIEARYRYIDASAAAACEIIYELILLLGAELTEAVANCIYTGISTDTGCFRYSNTSVKTHEIAGKMMAAGANWQQINTDMFEVKSREKIELERMVYDTLSFSADGKCALIYTTLEMQARANIGDDEVEGLASIPRQVEGVLIGITMKEKAPGEFRVSVRTNNGVNASQFCAQFGGGGHPAAAGCTVSGSLDEVRQRLINAAAEAV